MANLNVGTLAAGLGNSFKNIATAIPTAQSQIANAGYKGSQQRDLDWEHGNRVARYSNMRDLAKRMGYDDNMAEIIARTDMSRGDYVSNTLNAMRQGSMTIPYLENAHARQQLATPEGVVQAVANLPNGMNMPAPPEAPEGTPALPQRTAAVPQIDRAALQQRIAHNEETIKALASLNAMIEGKNQFGQANQYGYQPNNLIGGGNVVDPEMRTAKMTSEQALANQRNSSAMNSRAHAAHVGKGGGGGRGRGRPRKGGGRGGRGGGSGGSGKLTGFRYMNDGQGNYFAAGQDKRGNWQWHRTAGGGYIREDMDHGGRGGRSGRTLD